MPLLSNYAKRKKINFFLKKIPKDAFIMEVGAGSGWVGEYLKENGYLNYIGMDIQGSADVIGDIKNINSLPFKPSQFDVIIAFEVIEHVPLLDECRYFLKDGGLLMLTTPLPQMDWLCKLLENLGLNQKRTSPHDHLVNIKRLSNFMTEKYKIVGFMGQWGTYQKIA